MVNHIVLWSFREELSESERQEAAARIKKELEGVREQVAGVVSLEVVTDALSSSNRELGLISVFESEEALHNYQVHPAHVAAGNYVKTVTKDRACLDYRV